MWVECQSAAEQERWKGEIQQHALMVSYHTSSSGFMLPTDDYYEPDFSSSNQEKGSTTDGGEGFDYGCVYN